MQKKIVTILVSVLVVVGVIVLLRFWPPTAAHEGGQEIFRQFDQAGQQGVQGGELLGEPVYERVGTGETPPLEELIKADEITHLPDAVNPKAWAAIEHADELLARALGEQTEADPVTRSLGFQMLAEINKLKGAYHAELADIARRTADVEFDKADDALRMIVIGRGAIEYQQILAHNMLEGMSNEEIVGIRDEAANSLQAANNHLAEIITALGELEHEVALLTDQIDQLAKEEMDLRERSRGSSSAAESKELLDLALDAGLQRHELENRRAERNRRIELTRQQERLIRGELKFLSNRVTAADDVLATRRGQAQVKTDEAERIGRLVSSAEKELLEALRQLKTHCDQARAANLEVMAYYAKALDNIDQAMEETGGDLSLLAMKARLLSLTAAARIEDRVLQHRINILAERVDESYGQATPPTEIKTQLADAQAYLADPEKEDEITLSQLNDANDLLDRVILSVRDEQLASVREQLANVYFLLYEMTGQGSDLSRGHRLLGLALEDRGQFIEAAAHLVQAIRHDPQNNDAMEDLKHVVQASGRSSRGQYLLGLAREYRGELERAVSLFLEAIELDPENEDAKEALDRVRKAIAQQ